MKKNFTLIFILFINLTLYGQQAAYSRTINNFVNDSCIKNAPISIYVANSETGESLLDINGGLCITPASVMKLITTATALEILGPDFNFETTIWHTGTLVDNVLRGDIIITGGGDPSLGSQYFNHTQSSFLNAWAKAIKDAGIEAIAGNIIADPYLFSDQDVPQSWVWEDLGNYYGAAAQGINLYDNTFRIFFNTSPNDGGETEIINTSPFIPNLEIENYVRASTDTRDRAYVYGSPFDSYRVVRGTLPRGRSGFPIRASIPDPALLLAAELGNALSENGVELEGYMERAFVEEMPQNHHIIHIHKSPPLHEIIKQTNFESSNLFAESLGKYVAHISSNQGNTSAATAFITNFWNEKGTSNGSLFMADASGLSRYNAVNSKTMVEILSYMYNQSPHFNYFHQSIPLAGIHGTQQYFFQNSFLKGKARAKTGSMTRVRSLAGYMTTEKGNDVAFSIIINNFNCGSFAMAAKIEKILEAVYHEF